MIFMSANKLNPLMTLSPLMEPRPHCWERRVLSPLCYPRSITLGTLRSTTATSTKTSPQNITLLYHNTFVVILSRSMLTIWAKYRKNKLIREVTK